VKNAMNRNADTDFANWLYRRIPAEKRETLSWLLECSVRAVYKTPLTGPWTYRDAGEYLSEMTYLAGYLA
jgi:hypothetical protein